MNKRLETYIERIKIRDYVYIYKLIYSIDCDKDVQRIMFLVPPSSFSKYCCVSVFDDQLF